MNRNTPDCFRNDPNCLGSLPSTTGFSTTGFSTTGFSTTGFSTTQWGYLHILVFAAMVALLPAATVRAQPGEEVTPIVFLDEATPYKKNDQLFVKVRGKAPTAPAGLKIDFVLTWRASTIDTFECVLPADHRIAMDLRLKRVPHSREKFYFRTIIESKKQSAAIRKALHGLPTFLPALDPWTDHHFKQFFRLYDATDIDQVLGTVREFVDGKLAEFLAFDRKVSEEAELATFGEKYQTKAQEFDPAAWRHFVDGEIEKLLAARDACSAQHENPDFAPYRRTLTLLVGIADRVGARAAQRSRKLFRELGLEPDKRDVESKNFDVELARHGPLNIVRERKEIDVELGRIKNGYVEGAFELIAEEKFEGVVFRHLEPFERERGQFDPVRASATWTPKLADLQRVEAGLNEHLASHAPEAMRSLHWPQFLRQYVGTEKNGHRVIVCTLVHRRAPRASDLLIRVLDPSKNSGHVVQVDFDVTTGSYGAPRVE